MTWAPHRRWHHRFGHSLRWRLVALFLLLALAMSLAFVGGMQKSFSVGWRDAVRPLLADYVDRLAADLGTPPDLTRAQNLVARLPISVRIVGPAVQFDSHPKKHEDHWRRGEYGGDAANARLLQRTTVDGHEITFGIGDLNWRRGPGVFAWITLGVLLMLTALAFAYVRRLFKPLDDIAAGAQRFGAGDFAQPIPVRRHDELGDLAGHINTMGRDIHQMLDAKRALLLAISHELRSPLTRARLNTELLPETPETAISRSALLRDLTEMGRLITDLLESGRLSDSHAVLHLEPTDLAALVQDVVNDVLDSHPQAVPGASENPKSTASVPRFVVNAATDLPLIALDRVRIRLLLRNLVENALRHSPQPDGANETEAASIEVSVTQEGNHLSLSVRDHGAGVAESRLPHLAEPFFRPDAGRQRSTGGVGLGLYLCRLVAQAHGGKLTLQNAHPGLAVTATFALKINP